MSKCNNNGGFRISRWRGGLTRWGADLRRRRFLAEMYVKMKELGPVGVGGWVGQVVPPGSVNEF